MMTEHDRLCPTRSKDLLDANSCIFCELIRKVRNEGVHKPDCPTAGWPTMPCTCGALH